MFTHPLELQMFYLRAVISTPAPHPHFASKCFEEVERATPILSFPRPTEEFPLIRPH